MSPLQPIFRPSVYKDASNRGYTRDDKMRGFVRADVLEYLRPQLTRVLTKKDDAALFTIANNFAIRHHNEKQQADYDKAIWYSWIFYFYLATIHAAVRLIEKKSN